MDLAIKTDPKLFHHYIIAVGMHPMTSKKHAGEMFLKYRPIHFTNNDVEGMQHAAMLSKDKLFKTSSLEAVKTVGLEELSASLSALKLGASANQCTLHHFSSEFEMSEEDFEVLIKAANISESSKSLLLNSIIRG